MPYVLRGSLGEEYKIEAPVRIGRDPGCQIVLPDLLVSRNHATISVENGALVVVDAGSANGTRVNGIPVKTATLKPGDILQCGNTPLTVEFLPDPSEPWRAQTVVRGPDVATSAPPGFPPMAPATTGPPQSAPASTYPLPAYGQSAPAYPPSTAPVYGQPAAYPQAAPSGFGPPVAVSPPARKKSGLGRIVLIGCLLPLVVCGLLGVGGFVAFRAGLISLNTFGLGPGDISVVNRRGDAIRVAILELAPPSGTAPIRGALALRGSESRPYRVDVPGRYQVDFSVEASGAKLGTCLLTVKSGGRYRFEASSDSITITLGDPAATPGAGENIATSALCR
jgi:hypothetical protein